MYDFEYENMYEPTMADEIIMEYKNKMENALKDTVKNSLEQIKAENQRLVKENRKLQKLVSEIDGRERELNFEKENYKIDLKRERLSELLADRDMVMYKVDSYRDYATKKCNKCDKDRMITYKTPRGVEKKEECSCSKEIIKHKPEEFYCTEFSIDRYDGKLNMFYKQQEHEGHEYYSYSSSTYCKVIYTKEMDFKDIDKYDTFFKNIEDCQKYCDYLTNKEDK